MKKDEVAMNIIGKKCECFFLGHIVKGKITAIKTNENLCSVYVTFDNPEPWGNEVHKGAWFSFDVTYKIGCLDSVIIDEKSESEHIKYYTMRKIILLILTVFFVSACNRNNILKTKESIITDSVEVVNKKNILMSSIITISNIIPLETSELSILGEIEKVIKRDGLIYVKSRHRPLALFDEKGHFIHNIGKIGSGPEDYSMLADFDVNKKEIYILTINKIQVYDLEGNWVRTIPLDLNASGIRLTDDKMIIFALDNENVIHLLDNSGHNIKSLLKRNQALRICRNISFVKYGNYILFPMGRSNDILAYDNSENGVFKKISYLSSGQLSNEEESDFMENNRSYEKEFDNLGFFDGMTTDNTHVIFPYIKKGKIILWIKNIITSQIQAYELSSLKNDLTFSSTHSFFLDNLEGEDAFLTYVMPYKLKEYLQKAQHQEKNQYYVRLNEVMENCEDEGNPILIEYKIKDL